MCTALCMNNYFGRNLDLDRSYGEEVVVMPRRFPLDFRKMGEMCEHYAMIGMATVVEDTPLFYDASNEYGLSMAGLNFPRNAYYGEEKSNKDNITPFEFIPWILGQCKTVADAKKLLLKINLVNIPFSDSLPLSPLHWMVSDCDESLVVESRKDGLYIHNNLVHVLTNNPPFEYQLSNLEKYSHLRVDNKNVEKREDLPYVDYCQGLGAVGLPGDVSSMSRFVRAVFNLKNSEPSLSQFFHLLSSVEMVKGTCKTDDDTWDITVYSSCVDTDKGLYYYTTYDNRQLTCVNMYNTDLNSEKISRFPLELKQNILYKN